MPPDTAPTGDQDRIPTTAAECPCGHDWTDHAENGCTFPHCGCSRPMTTAALRPPMVWRADGRIRRADSVGYGDMVPDEDIWTHLSGHVEKRDAEMAAFCASVLLMRAIEREA